MNKVMIVMLDGSKMLFPAEYAKKVIRKNELVNLVINYQKQLKSEAANSRFRVFLEDEINRAMQAIRSINRQVPPCGEVVR